MQALQSLLPLSCTILTAPLLAAQRVVVPIPTADQVVVVADTFTTPDGVRRQFDVYRPVGVEATLPAVVFVNAVGPAMRTWPGYVDWARLVTSRGLAAVHFEAPGWDNALDVAGNEHLALAALDSLLGALRQRGASFRIDPDRLVLWAGSANARAGTPAALDPLRPPVRGYVLYYGSARFNGPRLDVPVFIARAGLDAPQLNRDLDGLARQLVDAGVAVTLVNLPAGRHGFDVFDSTAVTAMVINQTLDFMAAVTAPALRRDLRAGEGEARAAGAFARGDWESAVRGYRAVVAAQPDKAGAQWRLGLALLELGEPAAALAAFDQARALGQGGARDIGMPAARAAIRAGDHAAANRWIAWALEQFPRIRGEIAADRELAPLLEGH